MTTPKSPFPFNRPYATGKEFEYIQNAIDAEHLSGDGTFTKKCHAWLEQQTTSQKALLTHSCTAALEMSALLIDIQPGDEVIMPSYTFVSTANAFVLRGAVPVFVDIRADTLNIDETLIEAAITPKTKAIVAVHYAGVSCEMDTIKAIAKKHHLFLIEDAAQGMMASYKGQPLGSIGDLGTVSFHETKNVISGEGGALLINDNTWIEDAEIIREKGTNRSKFFRNQVDKYTWVSLGSSFLPSEIIAAFLWAQLEHAQEITDRRLHHWQLYHDGLADLENREVLRRPIVPADCQHNAHMYQILLPSLAQRTQFIETLRAAGILSVFHYVPLHSSPAGMKYGRSHGDLALTTNLSERLVRLPLWVGMTTTDIEVVLDTIHKSSR